MAQTKKVTKRKHKAKFLKNKTKKPLRQKTSKRKTRIKSKKTRSTKKYTPARKKKSTGKSLALERAPLNPIIQPRQENEWEAWQTFNPGVILLQDKIHFLYRAIGSDGISRFGYAFSEDGFHIKERLPYPVYEHRLKSYTFNIFSYFSGGSFGGAEDPRIVRVDEENVLYVTYTACDNGLKVALTSIKLDDFLRKRWNFKEPKIISNPNETHKNWVIFPSRIKGKYAILHSINPQIAISYRDDLEFKEGEYIESFYDPYLRRKNCWDNWVRGAGAPPLKTTFGWLLFYQAMEESDPGKYKVGVMLLDLDDPTKVIVRSKEPILEPEEEYENNGFKSGVVYVTGAVIKGDKLLVYYGASDSYVCVAYARLSLFLENLLAGVRPRLKFKSRLKYQKK